MEALYRQRWSKLDGLGALIISPTRELALQVCASMRAACRCRRHRRRCCAAVPSEPHLRVGETCVSCPLLASLPPKVPGSAPSVLSPALGLSGPALAGACAAAQRAGSPHLGAGSHAVPRSAPPRPVQIFDELRKVGKRHDLSAGLLIGGKDVKEEQARVHGEQEPVAKHASRSGDESGGRGAREGWRAEGKCLVARAAEPRRWPLGPSSEEALQAV